MHTAANCRDAELDCTFSIFSSVLVYAWVGWGLIYMFLFYYYLFGGLRSLWGRPYSGYRIGNILIRLQVWDFFPGSKTPFSLLMTVAVISLMLCYQQATTCTMIVVSCSVRSPIFSGMYNLLLALRWLRYNHFKSSAAVGIRISVFLLILPYLGIICSMHYSV